MSLIVLTGAVRSGKSAMAEQLAAKRGSAVVVAASGWDGDAEMASRIEAHRGARPCDWTTVDATVDPAWLGGVPVDAVLLLDCLGTLVSHACYDVVGDAEIAPAGAEAAAGELIDRLLDALLARRGDMVVVTNETGWGVVPAWPSARIFRDLLGRTNRRLIDAADAAYLVIDGRCVDLLVLPDHPSWPDPNTQGDR